MGGGWRKGWKVLDAVYDALSDDYDEDRYGSKSYIDTNDVLLTNCHNLVGI